MSNFPLLILLVLFTAQVSAQQGTLYLQALEAYDEGELEQAMELLEQSLKEEEADEAAALKLRGDIKQRQENIHGAMMDYARSEKRDPDQPRLYVSRAAARITSGDLKNAIRDLDMALSLEPDDPDAYYNRACAKYMGHDNTGALRDLERTLKLQPEHADALFLQGVAKGELFREEEGLADIEAALRLKPDIPGGQMSAAVLLFETEQWEAAIARFTQVIEQDGEGSAEAHYYRADSHYNLENKEKACEDWRRSALLGDGDAKFIVRNYCQTDAEKIPKKPQRQRKKTVIEF